VFNSLVFYLFNGFGIGIPFYLITTKIPDYNRHVRIKGSLNFLIIRLNQFLDNFDKTRNHPCYLQLKDYYDRDATKFKTVKEWNQELLKDARASFSIKHMKVFFKDYIYDIYEQAKFYSEFVRYLEPSSYPGYKYLLYGEEYEDNVIWLFSEIENNYSGLKYYIKSLTDYFNNDLKMNTSFGKIEE
jgi:hypothetical protein